MNMWKKLAGGVAFSAMAAAIVQPASAQETTSGVRGSVSLADGSPAANADVTITDTRTNFTRTVSTSASGSFDIRNLSVGGPYTVAVSAPGQQPTRVDGVVLNLGNSTDINLQFSGAITPDVIVITAQQAGAIQTAIGPSATFNLEVLENAPAINRDIKDILRQDPRIMLDYAAGGASGSNGVQCAGAHTRFNSLTVDGVRLNDNFGLNTNGYPTERIPFSYDSIQQLAVELAPFDVQYGGFTACNINAVTKSGTNNFHGSVFADYTDDGFYGDKTDGIQRNLGTFDEKRYGASIGGPIIPDTLFFFTSYEKLQGANIFGRRPEDVGITQAAYDAIIATAVSQYGYVAGGLPTSKPVEDEKFFVKLDWNINDSHRASATYNFNDGFNFSPSDDSATQISDGNHYYEKGAELQSYTGSLYSDWTDNFSTEVRVSFLDLANRQIPVAGVEFGEVQITAPRTIGTGANPTIYIGADDSRHANVLSYDMTNYKFGASYRLGDHTLSGAIEREEFNAFNLFVQETQGEWRFTSPANFAAGNLSYFEYSNAVGTNDQNDGAAQFGYQINTAYLQDEWQVSDAFNLVAGLRYEYYTSDDKPRFNQTFFNKYGYRNDETMDGRDVLQARVGFTYETEENVQFRGGFGLFSGGNPNVWISNNYSNDGVTLADFICQSAATATPTVGRCPGLAGNPVAPNLANFTYPNGGRPFFDVPQEGINFIANASGVGSVNALDPDFEIPSEWKVALGTTIDLASSNPLIGDDWTLMLDFLYSKANESALVSPIGYIQTGTAPDGRPRYGGGTNEFLLTNAEEKGSSTVFSAVLSKDHNNGIDWALGYAYTDAEDTNPMTSSVAFSNFSNFTTSDPLNVSVATSDYETAHRFTFRLNWELDWKDRWETRVSLFGSASQGAPYSYIMNGPTGNTSFFESAFSNQRNLAYIPTGIADPLISPTSNAAAVAALEATIAGNSDLSKYRGQIAERNISTDDWYTKFDLKLSQNLPGFMTEDSTQAFIVVENLGNLLNDSWGIQREHGFPGNAPLYAFSGVDAQNRYIITSANTNPGADSIVIGSSLWNVRFGLKYDF